ncbi:MAG TPA: DivIVA domain-containing protein [Euzebyales bacterium]
MSGTRDFPTAFIGYDRARVATFCDDLEDLVERLRARNDELEVQLEEMRRAKPITADQAFENVARETQRILQAARDAGERMVTEARERAENELTMARRERAQIVGDGYRARDEMAAELRQLDKARSRLIRQLHDATTEIEQLRTALDRTRSTGRDARSATGGPPRALTGTDQAPPPASAAGTGLRVVPGGDRSRPAPRPLPSRHDRRADGEAGGESDPTSVRRNLAALHPILVDRLNGELAAARDRMRERLRAGNDPGADREHWNAFDADVVAAAGASQLRRAYELGARAATRDAVVPEPATVRGDVAEPLARVLDERIGGPIRRLMTDGDRMDDPPWVLVERIDGIVSDAAAAMVSQVAGIELSRAYERGKLATWTNGDIAARRWVVEPRGHGSDETCRKNAEAGAVAIAHAFPSGERTPPRHDGCTCTTVVADEESDP